MADCSLLLCDAEVNRKLDSTTDGVLQTGSQGVVDRLNEFSRNLNNLTITVKTDGRAMNLVPNIVCRLPTTSCVDF